MKLNRYARALRVRAGALVLCFAVLITALTAFAPAVRAEAGGGARVSATEVPVVPSASDARPGEFVRVAAVPANIDIPDFYQEVINVSGMYIFTMPDGTVHKRIYGALDDVYGWYVPEGLDNEVPVGSEPVNTTEDAVRYYEAVSEAEREAMYRQEYSGIIPPDESVTEVEQLNGVAMDDITFYCVGAAILLCLVITIAAISSRRRQMDEDPYHRHR